MQRPSLHATVAALLSDTLLHILSVFNDLSTKWSKESNYFHKYPSLMNMKSWFMLYLLPDASCFSLFYSLLVYSACQKKKKITQPYSDKITVYFNIYMYRKYTFIVFEFFLAGINGAKHFHSQKHFFLHSFKYLTNCGVLCLSIW